MEDIASLSLRKLRSDGNFMNLVSKYLEEQDPQP